jgi:hypothetical protein
MGGKILMPDIFFDREEVDKTHDQAQWKLEIEDSCSVSDKPVTQLIQL